jgi:hypothetical protein
VANKANKASDVTADDVLRIGSQRPKAPIPKSYDDKEAIAIFGTNPAEPHHLSILICTGGSILAR